LTGEILIWEYIYPIHTIPAANKTKEEFQEKKLDTMGWTKLKYSKLEINDAGRILVQPIVETGEYEKAIDVINNFRACHGFPLLNFRMRLRECARKVYPHAIVAQRIKRITSISQKLVALNDMKLYRIQDIAGCRAIVETVAQVRKLHSEYYMPGRYGKHIHLKVNDYIAAPKPTGYRSLHVIYEYKSKKNRQHNGRKIEIQLRTKLQHAWATAVEVAGTFVGDPLKSNIGDENWLEFFRLVGSAFAEMENCPGVPGVTADVIALRTAIKQKVEQLQIREALAGFGSAFNMIEQKKSGGYYYVLWLNSEKKELNVYPYAKKEHSLATKHVAQIEKSTKETPVSQVVLVVTDNLRALKRAYPNYFLDTKFFLAELDKFLRD
jgi:hypothetical protein